MLSILSSIVKVLIDPAGLICLLLLWGTVLLWFKSLRSSRVILTGASALALTFGLLPIGMWLEVPLERRVPPADVAEAIDGIVVLGGAVNEGWLGRPTTNDAADRVLAMLALRLRFPEAKMVYMSNQVKLEQQLFRSIGIAPQDLIWDGRSQNTHDNAVFALEVARPAPGENWLLVTSASHMPRAVGAFRAVGWPVIPYAVDERTRGGYKLNLGMAASTRLKLASNAVYEWVGLVEYRLLGWISELYPSPATPVRHR